MSPRTPHSPVAFVCRLLWPARCVACRAYVPDGIAFCNLCDLSVIPVRAACRRCASPVGGPDSATVITCHVCRKRPSPIREASAALVYDGAVVSAILSFKHGKRRDVARPLGRYLVPLITDMSRGGADLIVPVPLHPRRLRARGFNQSLDLIHAARKAALALATWPAVAPNLLRRVRDTAPLGKEPPAARRQIVADAFAADRGLVTGKSIVVVDDVMTSGATLTACAQTLLQAGASSVRVVALARAVLS